MIYGMSLYILAAVALALHLAIAVVLVRKYMRTHDAGFIWLGIAVVIWPAISSVLSQGERVLVDHLVKHEPIGFFPFTLVENGHISIGSLVATLAATQRLVGVLLLLIAVIYLYRVDSRQAFSPTH